MADMKAYQADAKANPATKLGPTPLELEDLPAGSKLPADEAPITFYFKRKGYNDFLVRLVTELLLRLTAEGGREGGERKRE